MSGRVVTEYPKPPKTRRCEVERQTWYSNWVHESWCRTSFGAHLSARVSASMGYFKYRVVDHGPTS